MIKVIQEMIHSGKPIHHTNPGEKVIVFIHQSHKGEPHVNTFSVSTYAYPKDVSVRDELLAGLIRSKSNLSGYSRIFVAKMID